MSIMDPAHHLGRQVFDRDDVAADKIKENLDISLGPIKDLAVEFEDGVVTLFGECINPAHCGRTILFDGNIEGVIEDPNKIYPGQKIRIPPA